jgi:hypothetical protein
MSFGGFDLSHLTGRILTTTPWQCLPDHGDSTDSLAGGFVFFSYSFALSGRAAAIRPRGD